MSETTSVTITLNGKPTERPSGQTLLDLLADKGLDSRIVMVEVNEEAIRRERFGETLVHEGDTIEIVRMIAGG
ncbi:MAG: sulfur carrier protein ThiS [Verrucomicrobiota bacterium]|jgi:sulfur carrier protein|nr:sulfur carrier protein ThiS [Verrucomicrobiota bacterium]MDD8051384.1 sulfur carrier protein ThiS [Verrucomicrobiota bacterium]